MQRRRVSRLAVNLICRMRHDDDWQDVRIRNISSRDLGAMSKSPPATGQYAELRRGSAVIVARVVWQEGRSFWMRTQDNIDVSSLIDQSEPAKHRQFDPAKMERRKSPRKDSLIGVAEHSKRARFGAARCGSWNGRLGDGAPRVECRQADLFDTFGGSRRRFSQHSGGLAVISRQRIPPAAWSAVERHRSPDWRRDLIEQRIDQFDLARNTLPHRRPHVLGCGAIIWPSCDDLADSP